jgi:hypothetical protein
MGKPFFKASEGDWVDILREGEAVAEGELRVGDGKVSAYS